MSHNVLIEGLENRRLLSATPVLFDSTVARDRLEVKIDLLRFKTDILISSFKLTADIHRIHKFTVKGDTSLDASFTLLHTDTASLSAQLKADRLNDQTLTITDEANIKLDIVQIKKDKGNATAETADHAKLMTDRVQLQTDLLSGLDARIGTRTSFETTISNDTQAIVTAADADTISTGTAFTGAVSRFASDRVTRLNTLNSDLQTLATARQKLANDLTAEQ